MLYACRHDCKSECILITELISPSLCPMDGGKVEWKDMHEGD